MTSPGELAEHLGFGPVFRVLRESVTDLGDPPPEMLLKLPADFRREVLGVFGTDVDDLLLGLARLQLLVEAAPEDERARLSMAFNFGGPSKRVWLRRVEAFARETGGNETQIRKKVDSDLLNLLIRTGSAAEKKPEVPMPEDLVGQGSAVERFFDQDYVRNSAAFAGRWSTAATVDICGFGHNRMLISYSHELHEVLHGGGSIRVLLQDPDGDAIIHANYRSSTPKAAAKDARDQQRVGLATLAALKRQTGSGSLSVRAYDIAPPFTAYFFDAESATDGVAFIWFWSWRQASSWRPGFVISRARDRLWFDRFFGQFTALWTDDEVSFPIALDEP